MINGDQKWIWHRFQWKWIVQIERQNACRARRSLAALMPLGLSSSPNSDSIFLLYDEICWPISILAHRKSNKIEFVFSNRMVFYSHSVANQSMNTARQFICIGKIVEANNLKAYEYFRTTDLPNYTFVGHAQRRSRKRDKEQI